MPLVGTSLVRMTTRGMAIPQASGVGVIAGAAASRAVVGVLDQQMQALPKQRDEAKKGRENGAKRAWYDNAHEKNRQYVQQRKTTLAVRPS